MSLDFILIPAGIIAILWLSNQKSRFTSKLKK